MDLDINVLNDWDKWKKTLHNAVSMGETVGLSDTYNNKHRCESRGIFSF